MKSELEAQLHTWLRQKGTPRDWAKKALAEGWINSEKQVHATLEKWARKGLYEWGVCLDLGWLIEKDDLAPRGEGRHRAG